MTKEEIEQAARNNWDSINGHFINGLNPYAHNIGFIEGANWVLQSENERITSESKDLIRKLIASETRIVQLEKENERLKAEREWISVEDRLPENNQYVIVYNGDEFEFDFAFYHDKKFKKRDWLGTWKRVKSWMPLIKPPKQ